MVGEALRPPPTGGQGRPGLPGAGDAGPAGEVADPRVPRRSDSGDAGVGRSVVRCSRAELAGAPGWWRSRACPSTPPPFASSLTLVPNSACAGGPAGESPSSGARRESLLRVAGVFFVTDVSWARWATWNGSTAWTRPAPWPWIGSEALRRLRPR